MWFVLVRNEIFLTCSEADATVAGWMRVAMRTARAVPTQTPPIAQRSQRRGDFVSLNARHPALRMVVQHKILRDRFQRSGNVAYQSDVILALRRTG